MSTRQSLVWTIVVSITALATIALVPFGRATTGTEIQGRVYTDRIKDGVLVGPVSGAEVTTDHGPERVVTDEQGRFALRLPRRIATDEFVVLTVHTPDATVRQQVAGSSALRVNLVLADAKRR